MYISELSCKTLPKKYKFKWTKPNTWNQQRNLNARAINDLKKPATTTSYNKCLSRYIKPSIAYISIGISCLCLVYIKHSFIFVRISQYSKIESYDLICFFFFIFFFGDSFSARISFVAIDYNTPSVSFDQRWVFFYWNFFSLFQSNTWLSNTIAALLLECVQNEEKKIMWIYISCCFV